MYDIIVIGGGHAGVEAALSSARLDNKTLLVTGNISKIAIMSCNPSIGGPAKGIIVREIDALGGQMAKTTDKALLQIKMLNVSKGPAVRALRAQVDKVAYPEYMQEVLFATSNLEIKEAYVDSLLTENGKVIGIKLDGGKEFFSQAVILSSGTYLASRVLVGHSYRDIGPDDQKTTTGLSECLKGLGFTLKRLKTGTPPRLRRNTIDFSKLIPQYGDKNPDKFSEETASVLPFEKQEVCYLTYTSSETHKIIRENILLSSMYSGLIKGIGPRYCPSIEDKVTRFSDKERHQIFLEPESLHLDETYVQGLSTSFPHDIQEQLVHSVPGLENAEIAKYAYAIEYDAIDPQQLKHSLESKLIKNLFFAGQINGTSGYEEAACQGLMAGINAHLIIRNQKPLILRRDEAYIGVLIDDLITKGVDDPYRLLTSRAEFRLLLRHDNAEARLLKYGYQVGLISEVRYQRFLKGQEEINNLIEMTKEIKVSPKNNVNEYLFKSNKQIINNVISGYEFLKRPGIEFSDLEEVTQVRLNYTEKTLKQAIIEIKYSGYIEKEFKAAKKMVVMESRKIPDGLNYDEITNIASEAREKLKKIRPETIAQASRISGVNPSDIAILLVWLESKKNG
ncbi:MAG: tRNA uridine-5-carboxymethylaminomethyl(34) synthesis enzyme MnmG [Bacilli bacterium]|nr:tRNA uridine-5-carboxymethylaminomethyl(34) synthesis enzyme MnmG [Bacilli bacterium]